MSASVFNAILAQAGLPEATPEFRFDESRRWRFDYSWPAQKVALEVEGGIWTNGRHTRGAGYLRDMEKYNRATVLGWRVLRVPPSDLWSAATVAMLREVLKP
jgi:very-short-patch-repair endonuclease